MMQNAAWKPSKKSVISKIRDKQNRDKQGLPVVSYLSLDFKNNAKFDWFESWIYKINPHYLFCFNFKMVWHYYIVRYSNKTTMIRTNQIRRCVLPWDGSFQRVRFDCFWSGNALFYMIKSTTYLISKTDTATFVGFSPYMSYMYT